ncbi:MAG: 50S ribosomal protein L10 [Gammaproteobacteria bacterium]|nr:50S ribosomal protein L10 [Gammaproteobacteria bacterium]
MANQNIVAKKAEAVDKLALQMGDSKSYVLCEYAGLTVAQLEELRKLLRKENCLLKVATNNTIKRASAKCGFEELNDTEGPSCVVFSNAESVDGPRILSQFAKKNKKLKIKDGVVDGKYYDLEGIKRISQLPSKQTLIAMVAGGLYQPIQQLALGLHQLAEKLEGGANAEA